MFPMLTILLRFVSRRPALLPATVALLGSGILLLIWALVPLPPGTAAANPTDSASPVTQPLETVTWGPPSSFGEPDFDDIAPAVHPTDPLRALVGGPRPAPAIRYTTDGGATWQTASGPDGLYGGVPAWVPGGNGQSALYVSLSQVSPQANLTPGPTGNALDLVRSTDSGAHWSAPMTMTFQGIAENQPYLWADANPHSPYYGRMYLTLTMLDTARTGSFDTVGVLSSTDQGTTWSAPVGLVDPTEFGQGANYNAFASAAIQPSGGVVVAWHRGTCCQTITNVPNKVMWSRSTDGGVTFPVSGTIATVPVSQSLQYNSMAPGTFRWTPAPNIAADPLDGTLYAVWVAYRQPNTASSAAVYISCSTDNGTSWSAPVVAGSGSYQYWYMPWVQVSPDHVVHITFQGAVLRDLVSHFYVQSTDRGATWSAPFQLTGNGYSYFGQGDYQATSLGGYNGSQASILTSWQIMIGSGVRLGSFPLNGGSTPSPTATATPTCSPSVAWNIVPSPNQSSSMLHGVAAVSANDVWAVGSMLDGTLTEHWDGSTWNIVPSPGNAYLWGVAAVSSNDVWAVGYTSGGATLTEHWTGSQWSIMPSPNPGSYNELDGVGALSSNDVWAVGSYRVNGGVEQTLTLHWDGISWSVVPSPNQGPNRSGLRAVAAVSSGDVWAVGYYWNSAFQYQPLSVHWNGSAWSIVPVTSNAYGMATGVAAISSNDVWAVGGFVGGSGVAEHWNGSGWSVVPISSSGCGVGSVAAVSPNDVWAVGMCGGGQNVSTHTEHWNGTNWSAVISPNVRSTNYLQAVAAVSARDVWAVGHDSDTGGTNYTLTEHYTLSPCASVTPIRTSTNTPTNTPTRTATTPPGVTNTPTATATPCTIHFTDVQPSDWFYEYVRYLYCRGAISGYSDGTFRPYNNTTRGQMSKIVVLGFALPINTAGGPHFTDVPVGSTFYDYIETAYNASLISGYADGTFRPNNNVTRGQLSKIIVQAGVLVNGWTLLDPPTPTFTDVPRGSAFYQYIETAFCHEIISGYSDGTFRPGNDATRAQIAKIASLAIQNAGFCGP